VIFALLLVIIGSMQSGHGSTLLSTCFISLLVYGVEVITLCIPTTPFKLTGDNTNYGPKVIFCSRTLVFVLRRRDEPSTWNCLIPRARFRIALFQWMLLLLRCSYEEKPISREECILTAPRVRHLDLEPGSFVCSVREVGVSLLYSMSRMMS